MWQPIAIVLTLGWAAYFILHSVLASLRVKHWVGEHWPALHPYYRITYNVVAVALLLPLLYLTFAYRSPWLWQWEGSAGIVADAVALAAVLGFLYTTRFYSMGEFLGISGVRGQAGAGEGFTLSPLHRHVRHPWYFLGLLILWSRDMDVLRLISVLAASLYLFVGSRLEERKLEVFFGDAYREYRRRVPGLLPLPGRGLSKEQARRLVERARGRDST